ncbi:cytochrome-c peroxidase, partial [Nitrospira sp. BLG_2]|uniref:cytochrome-c peroxidase n=1 Tax=Nitrospira sp. BLG_2 TaxID=3397507 RepID=UPI003B9B22D1
MARKKICGGVALTGALVCGMVAIMPLVPMLGEEAQRDNVLAAEPSANSGPYTLPTLQGLEDPNAFVPADNPLTKEKIELGRILVFDKRLSMDNTIACMSCHLSEKGFTDGKPVATGIKGLKGGRSAPASFNRVYSTLNFWDGRAATLEAQSVGPFTNPIEHGFPSYEVMNAKMMKIPGYRKLFKQVFGDDTITTERVGMAIAS